MSSIQEKMSSDEGLLSRGSSDYSSDIAGSEENLFDGHQDIHRKRRRFWPLSMPISLQALLVVSISCLVFVWSWKTLKAGPTDRECATQLSVWSPALEAVEYQSFNFNNSFGSESIYRGPPTQEREDAWFTLTRQHGFEYPAEQLHNLNRSEADHIKHVRPEVGTGYVALLEVFHQLHCLNMVRQYTWFLEGPGDYITPPFNPEDKVGNRMHIDHCIETLRIAIMCYGDVSPVLVMEDERSPIGSKADFNSFHKCRNFDRLREWLDENWVAP